MVEEKQEGGVFCPPPPGKIGLILFGIIDLNRRVKIEKNIVILIQNIVIF